MGDRDGTGATDLPVLHRDLQRLLPRIERRSALLRGEGARVELERGDGFGEQRHLAGQSTYRALAALSPPPHEAPLRDALLRWVHELLQLRVSEDMQVADAEAVHAVDARLPARVLEARRLRLAALSAGPAGSAAEEAAGRARDADVATYGEAWRAILAAPDVTRAAAAEARAAELAIPVAAVRKERRARRFEIARRLGLAHPWSLAPAGFRLARAVLDATEPLAQSLAREARTRASAAGFGRAGSFGASAAMLESLGRRAPEGWPARPLGRWLDDVFQPLVPRGLGIELPTPASASSFLRGASVWGSTWRARSAPRSMPFALARDPYPAPAHRLGLVLASAIAEPGFQRRSLELPTRTALAQSRVLREVLFASLRTTAARTLLLGEEHVDAALFEEVTSRVFGAPLPDSMRDAWPDPASPEPTRFVALLGARALVSSLVARFDDDWYRNPRAGVHLTSLACGPAADLDPPPESAPVELARAFEDALG